MEQVFVADVPPNTKLSRWLWQVCRLTQNRAGGCGKCAALYRIEQVFVANVQAEQQAALGKVDGLHAHIASLQRDIQTLKVTELQSAMSCPAKQGVTPLSSLKQSQVWSAFWPYLAHVAGVLHQGFNTLEI